MNPKTLFHELLVAFPPDPPPTATEPTDLFIGTQEAYDLFPRLRGVRWTEFDVPFPWAQDALAFLLPAALAYYLPAFLRIVLEDPNPPDGGVRDTVLGYLEPPDHERPAVRARRREDFRKRFSTLTRDQRRTVARVLAWTREMSERDEDFPTVSEEALTEFWLLDDPL